jgi:putative endonuclease
MKKIFHVYIMTNANKTLYIGVTSHLAKRVYLHKKKLLPGFTKRYKIDRLVYVEEYDDALNAIAREKVLKRWTRQRKIGLIESVNPHWEDLRLS